MLIYLKGIITGIFVFSFWPGMVLLMLVMKYIVNPIFQYVINPLKNIINGAGAKNDVDAGVLEQDISTSSGSNA